MTQMLTVPVLDLIPGSAPFNPAQRAWLNGFFAGFLSLEGGNVHPLSPAENAAMLGDAALSAADKDDDAPWHDPAMALPERMKLAEGRPLRRRLMAAMAQQDCGQCGYNCADYADALVSGAEERLNLCVPSGKETAQTVKLLYAERSEVPAAPKPSSPVNGEETRSQPGFSRDRPVAAVLAVRRRLNKPGSEKDTWHIDIDLSGTGLVYTAGDSLGVYPANDPVLVYSVIAALGVPPDHRVGECKLADLLTQTVSLGPAPDALFQLFSYLTGGEARQKARALAAGENPDGDAKTLDVLAALKKFPACHPNAEVFLDALEPLQPRLYSISSPLKVEPARLSLTVDAVRYSIGKRKRLGAASTFLIDRLKPGAKLKVYLQKSHGFGLPEDPTVPIVMVGPGTGIAPFRVFLYERMATKASGHNWLFFGHQRRATDFFYEEELAGMRASGLLTRLTLAWSRDNTEKIYVQHHMREVGRDLWSWLAEGAHFYICGDAKHMAKDVERALIDVVATYGGRHPDGAVAFVTDLKRSDRFQADVY